MSVAQIMAIIKNHTGANYNPNVKITHQEVVEIIAAAKDGGNMPTMGARNAILQAVYMFTPNEFNSVDLFSSPEDVAALKATVIEGMETAAEFAKLPKRSQLKFIKWSLQLCLGDVVDINTVVVPLTGVTPNVQKKIDLILATEKSRAGAAYVDEPITTINAYERSGAPYGYYCIALWETTNGNGGNWVADFLLNSAGDSLIQESAYEPPDND